MQTTPVGELMSTDLVTVAPDASFKAVVRALESRRVDAAPVVDADGRLLGVVSERDLTCHEERPVGWAEQVLGGKERREQARKARARTADELMTSPARTVGPGTPVCEALREMGKHRVGRLVVVDDADRTLGILTRSDVLRRYLRDDADIRPDVQEAVRRAGVTSPRGVAVRVVDGVVELEGRVERLSIALAAVEAARSVTGVVDVDDAMVFEVDDTVVPELSGRGPFL